VQNLNQRRCIGEQKIGFNDRAVKRIVRMQSCVKRMMGRWLVETLYLQTLLEIVRTGSFSKAADNLCISQSAVSRRVKFMEDQYGHPLVDRSGPVVSATPAGDLVIEKSKQILEIERALRTGLTSLSKKGSLRFACTTTFGICYLPQILTACIAKNPEMTDLNFHFDTADRVVQGLLNGEVDVSVIEHCESFALPDLSTFALPADEMIFVSHADSNLPPTITHLDALLNNVLFSLAEGSCSRKLLESNLQQQGRSILDFKKVVVMDDLRLIAASAAEGRGIAFTSTDLVSEQIAGGSLKAHRVVGFKHKRRRSFVVGAGAANQDRFDFWAIVNASFNASTRDH
jgi:DNA-binding transcriptional LysR family regulator